MVNRKPKLPSSLQVYDAVIREAEGPQDDTKHEALEQRPLKLQVRKVIRHKHAERSEHASRTLTAPCGSTRKPP